MDEQSSKLSTETLPASLDFFSEDEQKPKTCTHTTIAFGKEVRLTLPEGQLPCCRCGRRAGTNKATSGKMFCDVCYAGIEKNRGKRSSKSASINALYQKRSERGMCYKCGKEINPLDEGERTSRGYRQCGDCHRKIVAQMEHARDKKAEMLRNGVPMVGRKVRSAKKKKEKMKRLRQQAASAPRHDLSRNGSYWRDVDLTDTIADGKQTFGVCHRSPGCPPENADLIAALSWSVSYPRGGNHLVISVRFPGKEPEQLLWKAVVERFVPIDAMGHKFMDRLERLYLQCKAEPKMRPWFVKRTDDSWLGKPRRA